MLKTACKQCAMNVKIIKKEHLTLGNKSYVRCSLECSHDKLMGQEEWNQKEEERNRILSRFKKWCGGEEVV
jgi:hypothetical protein